MAIVGREIFMKRAIKKRKLIHKMKQSILRAILLKVEDLNKQKRYCIPTNNAAFCALQ